MRNTTTTHLLIALAFTLASTASNTLAQQDSAAASTATSQHTSGTATTESSQTDPQDQSADEGTTAETHTASAPSAAAISVARWLRAIGGRISIGPKLTHQDRVSRPNLTDITQGWHVSTPNFAHARLSMPPARAALAKATTTEDSAQSDTVELATEPTSNE